MQQRYRPVPALLLAIAIIGAAMMAWPGGASAATPAVATANVNMRAGPSTAYPVVATLVAGAAITTHGCLADRSWCDVGWGAARGWVSAGYIQVVYNGRRVVLASAAIPATRITVVHFNQNYWNVHYVGRPWHAHYRYYRPSPYAVDRSISRSCGGGACTRTGVVTGRYGGQIVRHRTISRY